MLRTKKKDKTYIKAVRYYEEGELNKSIKLCDECISANLKNRSALNLKGLILYTKGDLEGARNQWKINSDYNDDSLAKNYIYDSKEDSARLKLYLEAEKDLKELKVESAIKKLLVCKVSDFNAIRVNLALAIGYYRKADYASSSVYISNVLSLDKNNVQAIKLAKDLKKYNNIKINAKIDNNSFKYIGIVAAVICILAVGGFTIKGVKNIILNKSNDVEVNANAVASEEEDKPQEEIVEETNDTEEKGETKIENKINFSELSNSINEKNYDAVYSILQMTTPESLTGQEKSIYYKGKDLLEQEGIQYFYEKGYNLYINKSFVEASNELTKGCVYGKDNYLYPHLIFFNASCYEESGNAEEAIKYYEEYYKSFQNSDYIVEVIYKLANLYKDRDIDKAVAYAKEIRNKYSSSMFNNDVISNLIDKIQ